jgi:hypothetical protein
LLTFANGSGGGVKIGDGSGGGVHLKTICLSYRLPFLSCSGTCSGELFLTTLWWFVAPLKIKLSELETPLKFNRLIVTDIDLNY